MTFDGTIKSLIVCYMADKVSGYTELRFRTRENYRSLMRRIEWDRGPVRLADVKFRDVKLWHQEWCADGKIAMGHSLVGMLRTLIGFGATIIEDQDCERLCGVLRKLRCKMPKARTERLTADQAVLIRKTAHAMGLHSIALAQAFQFEAMLRQKDVIGEWVPVREPGTSDVLARGRKWLRGLRWSEIDANLILRHLTSKRQKEIEVDLRSAPMVMEEFANLGDMSTRTGPIIIYEVTGVPYHTHQFRRIWRDVADAAGIPKGVKNMDSRAGAISEATDAGASLELVRHAATHSNTQTTAGYSRGSVEKTAEVQRIRAAHRKGKDDNRVV